MYATSCLEATLNYQPGQMVKVNKIDGRQHQTSIGAGCGFYHNSMVRHMLQKLRGYFPEQDIDDSDDIFKDRQQLLASKLELILLQLRQRKQINLSIMQQIDADGCQVQTFLYDLGPGIYQMSKERMNLEKLKLDLEHQRRMEQVSYFRDTGMLNKDLKDTLIQYLDEFQKRALINGEDAL